MQLGCRVTKNLKTIENKGEFYDLQQSKQRKNCATCDVVAQLETVVAQIWWLILNRGYALDKWVVPKILIVRHTRGFLLLFPLGGFLLRLHQQHPTH
jgi:hypothetical protein